MADPINLFTKKPAEAQSEKLEDYINQELVESLEKLLEYAKEGILISFAGTGQTKSNTRPTLFNTGRLTSTAQLYVLVKFFETDLLDKIKTNSL